jgi:hypothetical protein
MHRGVQSEQWIRRGAPLEEFLDRNPGLRTLEMELVEKRSDPGLQSSLRDFLVSEEDLGPVNPR